MIPRLPQEIRRPDSSTMAMLRESRTAIAARPVDLSAAVYRHLPTFAPRTRELIAGELRVHGERIVLELLRAIEALDTIASLEDDLHRLGAEHAVRYGVPAEHYPYLGQALVRAVRELFPGSDGGTLGSAWMEVYEWLAAQMLHGAMATVPSYQPPAPRGVTSSPAYWRAYVDADIGDPLQSGPGAEVDPAVDRTASFDREDPRFRAGEEPRFKAYEEPHSPRRDERAELLERLALAEEFQASPDIRGHRVLLPAEPAEPIVNDVRIRPGIEAAPPDAQMNDAQMNQAEMNQAEMNQAEMNQAELSDGVASRPAQQLPRPGSSSPWPLRAGSPPQVPTQRGPLQGRSPLQPAQQGHPLQSAQQSQEPTAIGRAQPLPAAVPAWSAPPPARGVGTGWPPDPPIKPPRPLRPGPEDLGDAPAQE